MRHEIEILFTLGLAVVASGLAAAFDLPLVAPTLDGAAFVGIHYLVPVVAALAWGSCMVRGDGGRAVAAATVAVGCYVVVLWLHFNIKLWVPFINPVSHDALFLATDEAIRPVVDRALAWRAALARHLPFIDSLYVHGFIALFYTSFCIHALRSPEHFRKVFLAALFFQGLGALAYLAFPCVGPFEVEPGANALASAAQQAMAAAREQILAAPANELGARASGALFGGLAAMPSLHAGGAFLFLWFAARWERPLLIVYVPIFVFILIEAVATRWHYVVDLPIGIALGALSIHLAFRLDRPRAVAVEAVPGPSVPRVEPA